MTKNLTLKEALAKGKLAQFIKERLSDEKEGDQRRFDGALESMAKGAPKKKKK